MDTPICSVHNTPMREREGQYGKFWSCPTKNPDGSWCKAKPQQPQAQKQNLSGTEYKEIIGFLSRIENMLKEMYVPVSKPKIYIDAAIPEMDKPPF